MSWTFESTLWLWKREAVDAWTFLSVPPEISDDIDDVAGPRKGFGSVPVAVTLGGTSWRTSVFPGSDGFVLPIKKAVRQKEQVAAGDTVRVTLALASAPGT